MNLYEISENYKELLDKIQDTDDDQENDWLMEQLDQLEEKREHKLENIAKYIRSLEGESLAIDSEIERLQNMKKSKTRAIDGLKGYVQYNLETDGIKKMETDLFKFSFRKSTRVDVYDESSIGDEYLKEKVTVSVDKKKLGSDLKEGKEIRGARLLERQNLQIK